MAKRVKLKASAKGKRSTKIKKAAKGDTRPCPCCYPNIRGAREAVVAAEKLRHEDEVTELRWSYIGLKHDLDGVEDGLRDRIKDMGERVALLERTLTQDRVPDSSEANSQTVQHLKRQFTSVLLRVNAMIERFVELEHKVESQDAVLRALLARTDKLAAQVTDLDYLAEKDHPDLDSTPPESDMPKYDPPAHR